MYLTFARYTELGGKLKEPLFIRAEMLARMFIDSKTNNRLQSLPEDNPIWEKVEFLVLELIERGVLGSLNGEDISSESNDGRSVSYISKDGKALELIKAFLPMFFQSGIIQAKVVRV